jgi:hypothetical protein
MVFRSFMMRHRLSLRYLKNVPISRANIAVEAVKDGGLKKFGEVIIDLKLYIVNESDITLVNRVCKIIAPKGSKTVFTRKSAERSEKGTLLPHAVLLAL